MQLKNVSDFLDIIYSTNLVPSITSPTRLVSRSQALIDNIFSSIVNDDCIAGIRILLIKLYLDILDKHVPITKLSLKEMKNSNKPWLTKGILKSINQKMLFTGNLLEPKIFIPKNLPLKI